VWEKEGGHSHLFEDFAFTGVLETPPQQKAMDDSICHMRFLPSFLTGQQVTIIVIFHG
jgi:hypothetical protein